MTRKPGRMATKGNKTFDKTDIELADEEMEVLLNTAINWDDLRPKISDQELYDKLIEAVEHATANNKNLAQLKSRLQSLGKEGWSLAKKIIDLVS